MLLLAVDSGLKEAMPLIVTKVDPSFHHAPHRRVLDLM